MIVLFRFRGQLQAAIIISCLRLRSLENTEMSRKSSRRKGLPKHNGVTNNTTKDETDTDFSPPGHGNNPETKILKATRKAAGRPAKRRQGKLRQMLDMPLDVVLEVRSLFVQT